MENKYTFIIALFFFMFGSLNVSFGQCNFNISGAVPTDATCGNADGSVEFFISAGTLPFTFDWSGGTVTDSNIITGMASGTYDITVTDSSPCSEVIEVTIQNNDGPIIINITTTDASCGANDGSVVVDVAGGLPPYQYTLGGFLQQSTNVFTNLAPGVYTIEVVDANGCMFSDDFFILGGNNLQIDDVIINDSSCGDMGSIEVTVTGGTSPYVFILDGILTQTDGLFSGLASGTYVIQVTDANGCAAEVLATVTGDLNIVLPFVSNPCGQADGVISVSADGGVPPYTYDLDGTIQNNGNFENLAAGTYTLVITDAEECTFTQTFVLTDGPSLSCVANTSTGYEINCVNPMVELSVACDENLANFTYLWSNNFNGVAQTVNAAGEYDVTITDVDGCTNTVSFTVTENLDSECGTIEGKITIDDNDNCAFDTGEIPFAGYLVQAVGDQTFFGFTDVNGEYVIDATEGNYEVAVLGFDADLWLPCVASESVTVTPDDIAVADFSIEKLVDCPLMEVQIATPLVRRCFDGYYTVNYCNNGTVVAENASITVTLSEFMTILNAPPYTDNGDDTYTFDLGNVDFGDCGSFTIIYNTSCDAILGQTLCATAEIFPQDPCIPANSSWSGASLEITATCDGSEVQYLITNVGTGNMATPTEYIVIEDGVMFMTAPDPFQLDAGQSMPVTFPANGATYILQVNQVEGHPGSSNPALVVEACGTNFAGIFTTGFVNQFPFDDADPFIDIDCHEVIGSYDPNDKQAFPVGYGDEHYITDSTEIDYLIRFQNTGTDTAFTVVVEDVISADLDMTTFRPGVSSHPYSVDIFGSDTVHFVFDNILLPDSNVNEPLSHGFIQFSIKPRLGLPLETVVENYADIFFDFNDPIRTNTVFHTVGEDFIIISSDHETFIPNLEIQAVPNPFSDETRLTLKGVATQDAVLHLYNLNGQKITTQAFDNSSILIKRNGLLAGMYFYKIEMHGQLAGTGKLIVK